MMEISIQCGIHKILGGIEPMERYIISMTGNELAKQLIADLGNGAATSDGDRACAL